MRRKHPARDARRDAAPAPLAEVQQARPEVYSVATPKAAKRKLALDLFSGVGRVAAHLRRAEGHVEEVDIVHGSDHDITRPSVCRKLCKRIRQGRYDAAMVAAPCTSFTVARARTCIIRTKAQPWGLADRSLFSANDLASLENGNKIMKAVVKILNALTQALVPWILENPRSSRMWHLPEVDRLMRSKHAAFATGYFCQYGTRWRKRTGYLCMHCNPSTAESLLGRRCSGSKGMCSRSGERHMLLQGSGAGGKPHPHCPLLPQVSSGSEFYHRRRCKMRRK